MLFDTHDIWPFFFWHRITLRRDCPVMHRFTSHENQYPYRVSNSVILKLPGTRLGLVAGRWKATGRTEEQMTLESLGGREMGSTGQGDPLCV